MRRALKPTAKFAAGPYALVLAVAVTITGPEISTAETGAPESPRSSPCSQLAPTSDKSSVILLGDADRLSVDIEGLPLDCVLEELGRQGEITVRFRGPMADDKLWHEFRDVPLYQGVRRLLHGKSYWLLHAGPANASDGATERVVAIHVLRSGARVAAPAAEPIEAGRPAAAATPGRPEAAEPADRAAALREVAERNLDQLRAAMSMAVAETGLAEDEFRRVVLGSLEEQDEYAPAEVLAAVVKTAETPRLRKEVLQVIGQASEELTVGPLKQALEDPDPQISGLAEELYEEIHTEALVDAVTVALQDWDWEVRRAALTTLEEMEQFAPVGQVVELALSDPIPQIRMRALDLLFYGDPDAALGPLGEALSDNNPMVREQAANLLDELEQRQASN
jgi:hypothetical protein